MNYEYSIFMRIKFAQYYAKRYFIYSIVSIVYSLLVTLVGLNPLSRPARPQTAINEIPSDGSCAYGTGRSETLISIEVKCVV